MFSKCKGQYRLGSNTDYKLSNYFRNLTSSNSKGFLIWSLELHICGFTLFMSPGEDTFIFCPQNCLPAAHDHATCILLNNAIICYSISSLQSCLHHLNCSQRFVVIGYWPYTYHKPYLQCHLHLIKISSWQEFPFHRYQGLKHIFNVLKGLTWISLFLNTMNANI